ncbi:uncharacterized protein EAE97_004361 [Botrytis byssoidea]|uniref:N-acetyltransferase domain-containing protein n=1 Tax=Botrytis byssoidea TaxID=139641 RepID=A0A9P5IQ77_9HELO|nr:uncharacterized protein EAE97_004361 [Botrytis byssoidea]KAF7947112.1 hypothetical protein EAE97_004361 [Botrytis byssoidea]
MSSERLITQILPPKAQNTYFRVLIDGNLAGNVFAVRWQHKDLSILWITQLCVDGKCRNRGVAKRMLGHLKGEEEMVGIFSSHPFALMAVLRVWGRGVEDVDRDLEMMKGTVKGVMEGCPVGYVKEAKLRGSLFGEGGGRAVACADTQFWVDHEEPLEALRRVEEKGLVWPCGELPDGCEFVALVDANYGD